LTVHFYCREDASELISTGALPTNLHLRCWSPDRDGFPPRGSRTIVNLIWWAFAKLGVFARAGFTEISIKANGELLHRLIVTPAWHRFPFMTERDLQLGDLWTAPAARRRQLARAAIAEAHRRFASENVRFWYVTDADNHASAELARSSGYRLVAVGERTRRFGTALFGQYVIRRFV
jgi:ribosomal protein S18 acetylase RimI-like enzyme